MHRWLHRERRRQRRMSSIAGQAAWEYYLSGWLDGWNAAGGGSDEVDPRERAWSAFQAAHPNLD
jgi:hypothetical protein